MFRDALDEQDDKTVAAGGEPLLSKGEKAVIFSKVEPILESHRVICRLVTCDSCMKKLTTIILQFCSRLYAMVNHWSDEHTIGRIWADAVIIYYFLLNLEFYNFA